MSNSIWKTPGQKPDVFKPHTIMVVYEAHDEAELMLSTQYEAHTADRYINRWCYLDELLAQADKAERLQKAVDLAVDALKDIQMTYVVHYDNGAIRFRDAKDIAVKAKKEIKQLIKENQ